MCTNLFESFARFTRLEATMERALVLKAATEGPSEAARQASADRVRVRVRDGLGFGLGLGLGLG